MYGEHARTIRTVAPPCLDFGSGIVEEGCRKRMKKSIIISNNNEREIKQKNQKKNGAIRDQCMWRAAASKSHSRGNRRSCSTCGVR